jgi:glycosyltransferase involved in cell wall biosynthesis
MVHERPEASRQLPSVSIIVPCRNERPYIARCLESILASRFPVDRLEVLVVDGQSDDGTRDVVRGLADRFPHVRLIDNPRRITPAALNVGLAQARGETIIRMDAHATYPPDYVSRLVDWQERTGADNVGGAWVTLPGADSAEARAIALALAHPFGVGNAHFRLGTDRPRWVDTVPFGCYRREVFARIGTFDEALVRNQDDEFNHRLIRSGGRILLVPDVVSHYYARPTVRKVARMYYQYGLFKPLVSRKVGRVLTLRQLVPATFEVALVLLAVLAPWSGAARLALAGLVSLYGAAVVAVALAHVRHGLVPAVWLCLEFPAIHLSYGWGFLRGLSAIVGSSTRGVTGAPVELTR